MSTSHIFLGTESNPSPPAVDHARMHADHLLWFSENAFWRDDVAAWQHEMHKVTLRMLPYFVDWPDESLQAELEKLRVAPTW